MKDEMNAKRLPKLSLSEPTPSPRQVSKASILVALRLSGLSIEVGVSPLEKGVCLSGSVALL